MSARTVVLATVGAGCIAAAGVGGFLALRVSAPARGLEPAPVRAPPAAMTPAGSPAPDAATLPAPEPAALDAQLTVPQPTEPHVTPKPKPSARGPQTAKPATPPPATIAQAAEPGTPPPPPPVQTPVVETAPPPPPDDGVATPVQEAPKPRFEELTVAQNSVIGIHLDGMVTSETARVEDKVTARVSRDVVVAGHTAIPAGARLEGNVTLVERGGKFKERARLGIRFTTLLLPDNTRQQIQTEAIFRDGEPPASEATSKVGASAAIGAILGAVIGGKKGAAIGTAAGAAGGTAAVAASGRNDAVFAAGTPLTVRLTSPLTVMIERNHPFDRRPR